MELNLSQTQTLALSPQMLQSMKVLQMGVQELLNYLEEASQENPLLELEFNSSQPEEDVDLRQKLEWLASTDTQNWVYERQDCEDQKTQDFYSAPQGETLFQFLTAQFPQQLDPAVYEAARFLASSLNQSGWLDEPLDGLARATRYPLSVLQQGLKLLQSLEPAGVGARSLSECLCLQLIRHTPEDALALEIVHRYLEPMSKSRYGWIARELNTSQAQVRAACDRIRALNPRPGAGFSGGDTPIYVIPDLFVLCLTDHLEVVANDRFLPTLQISTYYVRLSKNSLDQGVQDYLAEKMRQAKWVVQNVKQRRNTLLECAKYIVSRQEAFFLLGPGHLRPLGLADVARELDVHESTVSRTLKDKYLQCDLGTFPLSHFFPRGLGEQDTGEDVTPDTAKRLLRTLIDGEDKRAPLSDQKLCGQMETQGCRISRRTVAKYRDELGIPGAQGRREYR